jgi:hypothetical protein
MNADDDFTERLRAQVEAVAPQIRVDTSVVIPGARRHRTYIRAAAVAGSIAIAFGGWAGVSALPTAFDDPPPASVGPWQAPAWLMQERELRQMLRDAHSACLEDRGWVRGDGRDEWIPAHEFVQGDEQTWVDDVGADSRSCLEHAEASTPDPAEFYEHVPGPYERALVTWQCFHAEGLRLQPAPSESAYAQGVTFEPWDDPALSTQNQQELASLELTCPNP